MRLLLLLAVSATAFGVDHTDGLRITKGTDSSGASTVSVWLDQISGANFLVGNDGNVPGPIRYLFGSGLSVSSADGNGNRTISVSASGAAPSQSSASRSIGTTGWQISATRSAMVFYSVNVSGSVTLLGGAAGYVVLEIANNSGFTGAQEIGRTPDGLTGTVVVGVGLNDVGGGQLCGFVPAGWYARLRSVNTTGTPTYSYLSGQEVLQ